MLARLWTVVALIVATANSAFSADEFRPRFDDATLEMGKQAFPRGRIDSGWHPEIPFGGWLYHVDGDTVVQSVGKPRSVVRQARAPDGAALRWKGAVQHVAFLVEHVTSGFGVPKRTVRPVVRRLNLKTMEWLPDLEVMPQAPAGSKAVRASETAALKAWEDQGERAKSKPKLGDPVGKPERGAGISDVLVVDGGSIVLSYLDFGVKGLSGRAILGFQIAYLPAGADQPAWSHWIDSPENPQQKAPFSPNPSIAFAGSSVVRLTWTKTGVVVCLPFSHDLLCFNEKGEQVWSLPRIWEFERWNAGMWEIDRFAIEVQEDIIAGIRAGVDPKVAEAERKAAQDQIDEEVRQQRQDLKERAERFYKDHKAWIVAGPMRVAPVDDDRDEERLFFAVAKARFPFMVVAAPECVIYQVHPEIGFVEAMTTIPRMVYARAHIAIPGASVWTCERGSLVRIGTEHSDEMLCPVEWYREYPDLVPWQDWDHRGPGESTKVSCATAEKLFRTGFKCDRQDADKVLRFQINVVDLVTGLARDATLSLPYDGKIPANEDERAADPGCTQGFGAAEFRIAIEMLQLDGDALRVVIRTGKLQTAVEFDVKPLLKKPDPD